MEMPLRYNFILSSLVLRHHFVTNSGIVIPFKNYESSLYLYYWLSRFSKSVNNISQDSIKLWNYTSFILFAINSALDFDISGFNGILIIGGIFYFSGVLLVNISYRRSILVFLTLPAPVLWIESNKVCVKNS